MTTPAVIAPKKLIEVALPLDDINKACGREKSIRHGHPSTLHLWWARRPLAAARAVLFAQLVNDPSWKYTEEELKKNQIKGAVTKKRNELFKLISEFVQWESTTNDDVLERARKEIRASWRETCEANKNHPDAKTLFQPNKLPAFHDPFAGGGAIPLEAQRLGLEAHASDLNPVAVLINKAMIELPPKFAGRAPIGPIANSEKQTNARAADDWSGARGLGEDVRRYGAWMCDEAEKRIGHLYPKVRITAALVRERPDLARYKDRELTIIAWLWARTVASPNPAAKGAISPLVSSFILASKPGKEAHAELRAKDGEIAFNVKIGPVAPADIERLKNGTRAGKAQDFICAHSMSPIPREYIRDEAKAGRLGHVLMAVVLEGERERIYLSPAMAPVPALDQKTGALVREMQASFLSGSTPTRAMITGGVCSAYGLDTWGSLFTERQLVALTTLTDLVRETVARVRTDAIAGGMPDDDVPLHAGGAGARAFAEAIAVFLASAVDKCAEALSTLCTWSSAPKNELVVSTFRRQALPMTWDFAESNPFADSSGSVEKIATAISRVVELLPALAPGHAEQADAQTQTVSDDKIISTDPPYYDNIGYADLADYFYVWLRRALAPIFPSLFATLAVPKSEELTASPYRHGGKKEAEQFFLDGMTQVMTNLARRASPAFPATVYYAFKQSDTKDNEGTSSTGWETFLQAMLNAGLCLTGTWPMRTERDSRSVGIGTNALASSIILVCRPRSDAATTVARKDFLRQLERELPKHLAEMTADPEAAVAPVDLAQAAIGPGMAIFSKYKAVLEADGSPMSVHNALIHVNKAVDDYFAQAEGDLDADTRFCIGWFQQYGFETGPFGQADVLARAKGTAVDGVKDAGVISSGKNKVRLLRITEYPTKWDPRKDERVPIWEACHHMCRALGESEHEAGALLAHMPEKQDAIRQLAYRLYTICERQKWAEEARAYNELISSWPAIVEESHKVGHKGTQLDLLGAG